MNRYREAITALLLFASFVQSQQPKESASPSPSDLASSPDARRFGVMPKQETGALRHLERYPKSDGRGIVVAIFDTGVDPGAPGLQITSDGKPKIIDVIDGTGSGDVMMSTVRSAKAGVLEGVSGRQLKVDPDWVKENKTFRLGLKSGYDLFPVELHPRLKRERSKKFDKSHNELLFSLRHKIATAERQAKPTAKQKAALADMRIQEKQLVAMRKSHYNDPGPVYDCVILRKSGKWYAVVDTDEDSDLTDERLMTNFRSERSFSTFPGAEMNFAVNIFEDGRRLSIVTDSGDHGTHVAGIVGGYFPESPEFNGIAPGVQIVSVKIGDTRLESMEVGSGLARGVRAVVDNKCDLINMSYGEATSRTNGGYLIKLFQQLVDEHNVTFVAAAGNEGPALSTIITPGGASAVIGVGAYLSPKMMEVEYSLRQSFPGLPYTWSSRGPTPDGHTGVDIFAPGGAIASVPNWTLVPSSRMHGTSMASPNTCGGIALMMSKLKQEKQPFSPGSIRRAITHTASLVPGTIGMAQGAGLLQVDRATEYLLNDKDPHRLLKYRVEVNGNKRGIYLREQFQLARETTHQVHISTVFPHKTANVEKINYRKRVRLVATEDWIKAGHTAWLTSTGSSFEVAVDPTKLAPGLHHGFVLGYDADRPDSAALFRVPVVATALTPLASGRRLRMEALTFKPGQVRRAFVSAPADATFATVRLKFNRPSRMRFVVNAIQLVQDKDFREGRNERWFRIDGEQEVIWPIAVVGGRTMELVLGHYWSGLQSSHVDVDLTFHSIRPSTAAIGLRSGDTELRVDLTAALGRQRLKPSATLTSIHRPVQPTSAKLTPLNRDRDTILGRTGYELVLDYEIKLEKATRLTPHFPHLDGYLYDGEVESHLWMLFDGGKRRIATDDIWTDELTCPAGTNRLRLHLRHSDAAPLEALKKTVMQLEMKLAKPVSLKVHSHLHDARNSRRSAAGTVVEAGQRQSVYIVPPATSALPGESKPGNVLSGSITYGDDSIIGLSYGKRPNGFPLQVVHASSGVSKAAAKKLTVHDVYIQQLSDERVSDHKEILRRMLAARAAKVPELKLLQARLKWLDATKRRKAHLAEIVAACDDVLKRLDEDEIALGLGVRGVGKDSAKHKKAQAEKAILVDTLYRKGRALGYMELPDVVAKTPVSDPETHDKQFEENFQRLQRWVDTTTKDYFLLHVRRERRKGRYGKALELLNRHIKSLPPNPFLQKKRHDIFAKLGWKQWQDYQMRWRLLRFPNEHQDF